MSKYNLFYIGYKENNKIYPLGPYTKEGELFPVSEYSRSYIGDFRDDFKILPKEKASDELYERFHYVNYNNEEVFDLEYISYQEILRRAQGHGFRKGFVPIDLVNLSEKGEDYIYEDLNFEYLTPLVYETLSDKEKKKYIYYMWIDYSSKAYKAQKIIDAVEVVKFECRSNHYFDDDDIVIILQIC